MTRKKWYKGLGCYTGLSISLINDLFTYSLSVTPPGRISPCYTRFSSLVLTQITQLLLYTWSYGNTLETSSRLFDVVVRWHFGFPLMSFSQSFKVTNRTGKYRKKDTSYRVSFNLLWGGYDPDEEPVFVFSTGTQVVRPNRPRRTLWLKIEYTESYDWPVQGLMSSVTFVSSRPTIVTSRYPSVVPLVLQSFSNSLGPLLLVLLTISRRRRFSDLFLNLSTNKQNSRISGRSLIFRMFICPVIPT